MDFLQKLENIVASQCATQKLLIAAHKKEKKPVTRFEHQTPHHICTPPSRANSNSFANQLVLEGDLLFGRYCGDWIIDVYFQYQNQGSVSWNSKKKKIHFKFYTVLIGFVDNRKLFYTFFFLRYKLIYNIVVSRYCLWKNVCNRYWTLNVSY